MYDKFNCPFCKICNLVYLGNWEDCTSPNVEAAKCGSCGKLFLMGDVDNQTETLEEIIRSHYEFENDRVWENSIDWVVETFRDELMKDPSRLSEFLKEYAYFETGEVRVC